MEKERELKKLRFLHPTALIKKCYRGEFFGEGDLVEGEPDLRDVDRVYMSEDGIVLRVDAYREQLDNYNKAHEDLRDSKRGCYDRFSRACDACVNLNVEICPRGK